MALAVSCVFDFNL